MISEDEAKQLGSVVPNCIIQGDCIATMPYIRDHSVDLILVDLPYGVTQIGWDLVPSLDAIWEQFRRLLKPDGVVCMTATQPFATDLISSNRDWFRYDLIWVKNKVTGHLNAKKMPLRAHESILVFYDSLPTYHPQMTSGHEPLHYAINKNKTELYGEYEACESRTGATDRYPRSVLEFDVVNNSERIHPTQKPVELFSYLINTFSDDGEVVLDIAAGSLTTALAAQLTHRKYICIEKEPTYIESGVKRLKGNLFTE